ncbi:restriction endonuclease subunit S [Rossellomorea sp. FM04394]|uniref:restriction endonuclease subunit S n=1 Tax=Rossellomorea sp. FM04394 TaxID=3243076 RepID=UPI0035A5DFEA
MDELLKETMTLEEPYEVPENWVWGKLGNLFTLKSGKSINKIEEQENGELAYIKVADMNLNENQEEIRVASKYVSSKIKYQSSIIPPRSVIFPKRGGAILTNKKRLVMSEILCDLNIMAVISPKSICVKYLYYWFLTVDLAKLNNGSSVPQINNKDINPLSFPLPPLNEQKRIAEKVELLLHKVDEAKQLIEEAKETFEIRRASILEKALRGEMTIDWRNNKSKVRSGETLLTIINEQREKIIQSLPKSRSRKNKIMEIREDNVPFQIPPSWIWVRLGNISTKIVDGAHHTPKYIDSGIPFLSVKDIKGNKINFDNTKFISYEEHSELIKRCYPQKGDLLITKSGTIGRTAVVDIDNEFSLFVSVALIKLAGLSINPRFIEYMIELLVNYDFGGEFVKGSAIKNLHLDQLINLPIPLPSLEEQEKIVSILNKIFIRHNESIEILNGLNQKTERLKQSILTKAFRGELGTNDPAEENAIELLKEILQEQVK